MKRVLSGVQPSEKLHIGNYFGAIRQFIGLQDKFDENLYFAASYHALTTARDPEKLKEYRRNVIMDYLALGLDPEKSIIFDQVQVPEVTELSWILSCYTPMGLLERAHSYKDKVAKGITPNAGLFNYPVLMAADILIYDSNVVPVGKDQKQHLEITRDIAQKINSEYDKEVFIIPEPYTLENTAVVPGIDGQKMSKSYGNGIEIFAPIKQIKKKIMSIVTDSTPMEEPKEYENCNVFNLFKLFADENELEKMKKNYKNGNYGYGHAKLALFEKFKEYFKEAREKKTELEKNLDYIDKILKEGGLKAREIASKTMNRVRKITGIERL